MRISIWVAVVCVPTRRVLIARRAETTRNAGQWNFFGGGLDAGERPFKAALRELKEEAGVTASKAELVELGTAPTPAKHNILFGLPVDEEFAPKLNGESTHWAWVTTNELRARDDLHLSTRLLLTPLYDWIIQLPEPSVSVELEEEEDDDDNDKVSANVERVQGSL